ncbi:MAG: hypothetical protein JW955_04175, partial [Sedimentisphaerales bacterium]|nr:hypothetical protein [Sedimentisphaerales bacterium]
AGRANLAAALLRGEEPYGDRLDPQAIARKYGHVTSESDARFLVELLLQGDIEPATRDALSQDVPAAGGDGTQGIAMRRLAHAIVTLPEYHLA